MAKKARSRIILVKLVSTAMTGFFYTMKRPRVNAKMSFIKFDPKVNRHVLFEEVRITKPN
ncbi:54S ribosomal protein L39, mitochondrial [Saitoella coloradoensis]